MFTTSTKSHGLNNHNQEARVSLLRTLRHKFMKTTTRYILTILIFATLTGCFIQTKTRKPKSDLNAQTQTIYKIDKRVQVETIEVVKIDTTLNLFKGESLIGITVKGQISKANNSSAIDYFDDLNYIETIDNQSKQQTIEIVPNLKTTNPNLRKSKPRKTNVKYNFLSDKTEFEFYVEKKIYTLGFGQYQIDVACGLKKETIWLFRRK